MLLFRRRWPFILLALWLGLAYGGWTADRALAQQGAGDSDNRSIGKVMTVSGSVTIERTAAVPVQVSVAGRKGEARIGDQVYEGDIVETASDGTIGIRFLDGTSFNLSKNARIELNDFVYKPKAAGNSTLLTLQKGTLTFIAGTVARIGDMKVETPVATMGIRGTAPRVEILEDGTVKFSTLIEEYKKEQPGVGPPSRVSQRVDLLEIMDLCNNRDPAASQRRIVACKTLADEHVDKAEARALLYNNMGTARVVSGDYARAIEDYTASINQDGSSAKAFNNRGIAFEKSGDTRRALADFSEALKIAPDYVPALANRSKLYEDMGDVPRAVADLSRAIELQPDSAAFWNQRCWLRAVSSSAQDALNDCNEALRRGAPTAARFDSRGLVYLKLGNAPQSVADYDSALRINPRSASALYGRGLAKRRLGDRTGGDTDVAAALRIDGGIANQFVRFGLQ
jgi:regulator of sirC expression with transglutaminase-like and TPR domain